MAVLKIEGPPGSGKTRELAREACRLAAEEKVAPERILLLAVTPLQCQRLRRYLSAEAQPIGLPAGDFAVMTFDAWLWRLLTSDAAEGGGKPKRLSDRDAAVLLQALLGELTPEGHPFHRAARRPAMAEALLETFHRLQRQGLSPDRLEQWVKAHPAEETIRPLFMAQVWREFQLRLKKAGLICGTELQDAVYERLLSSPAFREKLMRRYEAILVDDAQELSEVRHRILTSVSPSRLVLAGNGHLSIRSFRGAAPEQFLNLSPSAEQALERRLLAGCPRGNAEALRLLSILLPDPAESGTERRAESADPAGCEIHFAMASDPLAEAEAVAMRLEDFRQSGQVGSQKAEWRDCVVLLRSLRYREVLIQALLRRGIPLSGVQPSEGAIRIQNAVYHLLSLFEHWQTLGYAPFSANPPVPAQKRGLLREIERSLAGWLECVLPDGQADLLFRGLPPQALSQPQEEAAPLWSAFQDAGALPEFAEGARNALIALHRGFRDDSCPVRLLDAFAEWLDRLPDFRRPDALSVGETVQSFREALERLDAVYCDTLGRPFALGDALIHFSKLWEVNEHPAEGLENAVRLLSFHQVQGEAFPFVAIPFMVREEFPYIRPESEWLPPNLRAELRLGHSARAQAEEETRLLVTGGSRATQQLVLSCHAMDGGEAQEPSLFYHALRQAHAMAGKEALPSSPPDVALPVAAYAGTSEWAKLPRQEAFPAMAGGEPLQLSASAIKTYMLCPLRFYYSHGLRLKPPEIPSRAMVGVIFHRILEVFNRDAGRLPYTAERLRDVASRFFGLRENAPLPGPPPQRGEGVENGSAPSLKRVEGIESGSNALPLQGEGIEGMAFEEKDRRLLARFGPLALSVMRQRFEAIIEDLERKGYFRRYRDARRIEPEKRLDAVRLEGLDCVLSGTVDALIETADGSFEILDYKAYRDAFTTNPDTCETHFQRTLDPLPEEEELSHSQRFADKQKQGYPLDYQLPLYYLACNQDPAYRGNLRSCQLQLLRPRFPERPEQGAIALSLPAEAIEAALPHILDDLQQHVIAPIRQSKTLAANPAPMVCRACDYAGICESAPDDASDEVEQESEW